MILNTNKESRIQIPTQIARLPGWRIVSRPSSKKWQVCLNKRRRIDVERTVPYGYTAEPLDDEDYELMDALESLYNE